MFFKVIVAVVRVNNPPFRFPLGVFLTGMIYSRVSRRWWTVQDRVALRLLGLSSQAHWKAGQKEEKKQCEEGCFHHHETRVRTSRNVALTSNG